MSAEESDFERGRKAGVRDANRVAMDQRMTKVEETVGHLAEDLRNLAKQYGEFVAAQTAAAQQAVSTKTFLLGVAGVIVTLLAIFLSHAS